jgi:poly [ADP-ribose] polymerase 2/3/4
MTPAILLKVPVDHHAHYQTSWGKGWLREETATTGVYGKQILHVVSWQPPNQSTWPGFATQTFQAAISTQKVATLSKMPPKRAAAKKASASAPVSNGAQSAPKPPSKRATRGKKRAATPEDDEEEKDKDDDKQDDDVKPKSKKAKVEDDPPAKMVSVVQRGKAVPVDPHSPYVCELTHSIGWIKIWSRYKPTASHEVYTDGTEVYDAMLNQTVLKANSNK